MQLLRCRSGRLQKEWLATQQGPGFGIGRGKASSSRCAAGLPPWQSCQSLLHVPDAAAPPQQHHQQGHAWGCHLLLHVRSACCWRVQQQPAAVLVCRQAAQLGSWQQHHESRLHLCCAQQQQQQQGCWCHCCSPCGEGAVGCRSMLSRRCTCRSSRPVRGWAAGASTLRLLSAWPVGSSEHWLLAQQRQELLLLRARQAAGSWVLQPLQEGLLVPRPGCKSQLVAQ